jgi:hypothetical protein
MRYAARALIAVFALLAAGAPARADPSGPSAVRFTLLPHTHFSVKPGYTMVVLYRGGTPCSLQVRRDSGRVTMMTIDEQGDPRGLVLNANEMLGNISEGPCYIGVSFYSTAGPPGSAAYTTLSKNK